MIGITDLLHVKEIQLPSQIKPSPFANRQLRIEIKGGFTGKGKDKLGRIQCYLEGEHVPCGDSDKAGAGRRKGPRQGKYHHRLRPYGMLGVGPEHRYIRVRREGDAVLKFDGSPAPEHILSEMISPEWVAVIAAISSSEDILVKALDKKAIAHLVFNGSSSGKREAAYFSRTKEGIERFEELKKLNKDNFSKPNLHSLAQALALIQQQGIDPDWIPYIRGTSVVRKKDEYELRFHIPGESVKMMSISDPELGRSLWNRKNKIGYGKLFSFSYPTLVRYSQSIGEAKFTPQDYRRVVATLLALLIKKEVDAPADFKEYQQKILDIGQKVADTIDTTLPQSLGVYTDPSIFTAWQIMVTPSGAKNAPA